MNNFQSAHDLMATSIERLLADKDISGKIDLSELDRQEYAFLVYCLTKRFCHLGNYEIFEPNVLRLTIKKIREFSQ